MNSIAMMESKRCGHDKLPAFVVASSYSIIVFVS